MTKVIGIGGCSRSGKSSLAKQISDTLHDKRVLLLDMDDFVFADTDIPKIRDRTDWEQPDAVDFDRLNSTIKEQKYGYDLIVVEGILVFANEKLLEQFDTTVFIEITRELFLARRSRETRWGVEPDWFLTHVWDSYQRYGQYTDAHFVLSSTKPIFQKTVFEIINSH